MISINDFILEIPQEEILVISNNNPSNDELHLLFNNNNKLNAIKYTMTSKNIVIDSSFNKYFIDIITNIRCNDDTILLLNKQPINCIISKLTIPTHNTNRLEIISEYDITYDVYMLSDTYKKHLIKKRMNKRNIFFLCYFTG